MDHHFSRYGENDCIKTSRNDCRNRSGPGLESVKSMSSAMTNSMASSLVLSFRNLPSLESSLHQTVNLASGHNREDLDGVNMIDPFHLQAYGETTVNYNQ